MSKIPFFKIIPVLLVLVFFLLPSKTATAQEIVPDTVTFIKAEVVEILEEKLTVNPVTGSEGHYQSLNTRMLEGERKGEMIVLENRYPFLKVGEKFYARHTFNRLDGIDWWVVAEPYRIPAVFFFIALFLVTLCVFGGKQGLRGLLSLSASLLFIWYVLLPSVVAGQSPILVSIIVASFIVVLGSYITHGFSRTTTSAVIGMLITVLVTGGLAYAAIYFGKLTGFSGEEASFLYYNTHGSIDLAGVLFGGILIGLLGILYDAAIGQAVAIDELSTVGKQLSRIELYKRGLRIGREHIGALVNMLAIAYVGASFPLLLLFRQASTQSLMITINQEQFATEILRTMIGSTGIILAVPITTAVAVYMLHGRSKKTNSKVYRPIWAGWFTNK